MMLLDRHWIMWSSTASNFGVIFDGALSMHAHINEVCRVSMFRKSGNASQWKWQSSSSIFCIHFFRLYCNSILYDLPSTPLSRLQRVQNIAARSLTRTKKHDHILSCTETFTLTCCFESCYLQTHAFHFPFHKCFVFAGLYNNTYDRPAQKMRDSCTVLLLVRGRRLWRWSRIDVVSCCSLCWLGNYFSLCERSILSVTGPAPVQPFFINQLIRLIHYLISWLLNYFFINTECYVFEPYVLLNKTITLLPSLPYVNCSRMNQ